MIDKRKLQSILQEYKKAFPKLFWTDKQNNEKYKWVAVKHFQVNWDIDAPDFLDMFTQATAKTENKAVKPVPAPVQSVETEAEEPEFIRKEIEGELNPNNQWEVYCPECGKKLRVKEVSLYHRCPACDKVFKIRRFETYVKKD